MLERGRAIAGDVNRVGMFPQAFRQHLRGNAFVFDDQNPHGVRRPAAERALRHQRYQGFSVHVRRGKRARLLVASCFAHQVHGAVGAKGDTLAPGSPTFDNRVTRIEGDGHGCAARSIAVIRDPEGRHRMRPPHGRADDVLRYEAIASLADDSTAEPQRALSPGQEMATVRVLGRELHVTMDARRILEV